MKLPWIRASRGFAFAAGAFVVHCGTTEFSVVSGDGGASSRSSSSHSGGSSGSSAGDASSAGSSSTTSSSSSASSSSSGAANGTSCTRNGECASNSCCVDTSTFEGVCKANPVCSHPCNTNSDCAVGVYCCVDPALGKTIGACTDEAMCKATPGTALLCSSNTACSDSTCVPEMCIGANACSWTTACGAKADACVPYTCTSEYSGRCGTGLMDNCGGTLDCTCPASETCAAVVPGTAAQCTSI